MVETRVKSRRGDAEGKAGEADRAVRAFKGNATHSAQLGQRRGAARAQRRDGAFEFVFVDFVYQRNIAIRTGDARKREKAEAEKAEGRRR